MTIIFSQSFRNFHETLVSNLKTKNVKLKIVTCIFLFSLSNLYVILTVVYQQKHFIQFSNNTLRECNSLFISGKISAKSKNLTFNLRKNAVKFINNSKISMQLAVFIFLIKLASNINTSFVFTVNILTVTKISKEIVCCLNKHINKVFTQ